MVANVGKSTSSSSGGGSFECNICFEVPREPVVTLCGHLFCQPCIYRWLHIHSHSPECPVCKAFVNEDKLVPLYGCGKGRLDPRSKNNVPGGAADVTHRPNGRRPAMVPDANLNRQLPTRKKKKKKRLRQDGGDASTGNTRSDELVENQQTEGAARSIYVVVNIWDTRPVHAFYKVGYPYLRTAKKRLLPVATLKIEGGKNFVSVHTRRRKWIVAVGDRHSTVIIDAETEEVIHGPSLLNAKDGPVLVAVEDKVYALSRVPKVKGNQDFEPWFEVLDLSRARVVMAASSIAPGRSCLARLASRVT